MLELIIGSNKEHQLREFAFPEIGDRYSKYPDTDIVFKGYLIEVIKNIVV